jgi:hypothetical protein
MMEFSDFIFYQGLMDLPLVGGTYTWSNNQESPSWSRLIDFLFLRLGKLSFLVCPREGFLDFARIISQFSLTVVTFIRGSRYFKFENMWLKSEGFVDRVKQWWDSYHFQGSPSFIVASKLKALKVDLRRWNEEVFGNVGRKKKILLEELCAFDIIEEERALGDKERMKKAEVLSELERSTLMEEVSWRQKSRALWLREGDKCTKFFHKVANSNRRKNSIDSLLIDGTLSTNRVEISEHIVQFYKKLYTEQFSWQAFVGWPFL